MPALSSKTPSRNTVTTIRADGSRRALFPADVRGRFARARRVSSLALIAFYLSLPWIQIKGYPAVFIDIGARRFHLFGITLAAQDMWLMFFVITGLGFTLFFLTALLGRVWCGWACPHTVFLDQVYRRIERWIDGDSVKRRALHDAPLGPGKILRRVVKHALYILVSAVITHLFLAYFVSIPEVWSMIRADPLEHWTAFLFILVATGVLYFNFAWFREQLCIVICPYGRLQSALIDDHSLVIGYDTARGEPRGKIGRNAPDAKITTQALAGTDRGACSTGGRRVNPLFPWAVVAPAGPSTGDLARAGDCVDCLRCVQVCPTGIDIRQGLQMECVGCTACIDVCDEVMTRLHRPPGLIRYDSQKAFTGGRTRWVRPRTILYGILLAIGASVATWALSTIEPANFAVMRMVGAPYIVDTSTVRNQFLVRLVNKGNLPAHFTVQLQHAPAGIHQIGFGAAVEVGPLGELVQPLILQQARSEYAGPFSLEIEVQDQGSGFHLERKVQFLGPDARLLREDGEKK
jgi:polyferredoxin